MKGTAIFVLLFCNFVNAYETQTHDLLSESIVRNSVLVSEPELLISLGLDFTDGVEEEALPSYVPRNPNNPTPKAPVYNPNASILEIIRGGSVLEDQGERPVNHFFDPLHDRPIEPAPPLTTVHRSVDWITEINAAGERIQISQPEEQLYSYSDGIDYFYAALTQQVEEDRKVAFGKVFRSLGHVIHHIQDMAQPQHTRNDAHCDSLSNPPVSLLCIPVHNPSHYEQHTNLVRGDLPFAGYPLVEFEHARDFWSTSITRPNIGQGMADFSNTNFVTQDTNFELENEQPVPDAEYPLPRPEFDPQGDAIINYASLLSLKNQGFFTDAQLNAVGCAGIDPEFRCKIEFYQSEIKNNYPSTTFMVNEWASSLSIFDKYLMRRLESPKFTLNRINFEEGFYPHLIPRAVAYGAGLINHFFRGRLEVESSTTNASNEVEVVIKNTSAAGNQKNRVRSFHITFPMIEPLVMARPLRLEFLGGLYHVTSR